MGGVCGMRLFTEGEIRYLEADCMKALGPEDPTLMTRAGRALGEKCLEIGPGLDTPMKVLVVCGKGGNGGDGLVAAGFLQEKGHSGGNVPAIIKPFSIGGEGFFPWSPQRTWPFSRQK